MIKEWEKETLIGLFNKTCENFPDRLAAVDASKRLSYGKLKGKVDYLSTSFKRMGLKKRDIVMVQIANSVMFEIVIFSLFKIGAVPILILPAHKEHVIDAIIDRAKPKFYITMNDFYGVDYKKIADKMAIKYPFLEEVLTVKDLEEILEKPKDDLRENIDVLLEEANTFELVSPKDLAILELSGGTTGIPKLIPRYHGEYSYNAISSAKHCAMDNGVVNLSAIPVSHNFAFGTPGMIGTVYVAGLNVFCEYPSPVEIFDWIEKEHVTMLSLVPSVVNLCVQYRQLDESNDLSSLKYVLVGGASFTSTQAKQCEKYLEARLIQVYGMTEGMTFLTAIDAKEEVRFYTQGKPCAKEDEFRIVDSDFNELADGLEGEVVVKGPYTITEYYKNPVETRDSFYEGFYRPGDKGKKDRYGNIIITGRAKEMINRAGEKIMPSEVEKYFVSLPEVKQCAAVGKKDELLGEAICVFYEANTELSMGDVRAFFKERNIEDYCIPDKIVRVTTWPLTAVGKIDKSKL